MDAVEFAKTMREICRSHTSCVECEFVKVQGHCGITNPEADHAGMVAVAEQWAREHVEEDTEKESRNVLELMVALTDKVDRLAEKIKVAESMIEESSGAEKAKKKRTNKDALLAAFPNARVDKNGIPDMCPLVLNSQYDCNEFASCSLCKRTHWLAEVEE